MSTKVYKSAELQKEAERKAEEKAANKRGEYKYTSLKDCTLGEDDLYHFYAVILDAQFPHKSYKTDRFVCTLRIADPTTAFTEDGVLEHCSSLVLFANKFTDLPICQRVGDIIRVHRAHV